jgi:flagellar FliJ protein
MQNILELKEKLEEQEKNNFAMRQRQLNEEQEILDKLLAHLSALEEEGKALRLSVIDVLKIKENERSVEYAEEEVKKQRIKVRVAEKNLEAARTRMQEAIQERKIHEKMREKAFERFVAEVNAAEVKEIDELTSYVYGTRTPEE